MLMVTKVVAAGVTAFALGGSPSPNVGTADVALAAQPAAVAQSVYRDSQCVSGCNVWRMIYDGR